MSKSDLPSLTLHGTRMLLTKVKGVANSCAGSIRGEVHLRGKGQQFGGLDLRGAHGCVQVKDIVFLHKYNEPVLLILHEVAPTWPARYRDSKDTMALTALSINVVNKRHPKIWDASALPSDTFLLIPVPSGGAVALSQNMIMYFTQVIARLLAFL